MNNIDLTKLTPKEINDLQKQLSDIKKSQKPFTIEEDDTSFTIKVSKSHFLNESKVNQKNGNPYTLLFKVGSQYGMEKVKVNDKTIGVSLSLSQY